MSKLTLSHSTFLHTPEEERGKVFPEGPNCGPNDSEWA